MNKTQLIRFVFILLFFIPFTTACIRDVNLYQEKEKEDEKENGKDDTPTDIPQTYLYPFSKEVSNAQAEIIIHTKSNINANQIKTEIPPLKYNKKWLFMLTQDDAPQSAFSFSWAAINGKPLLHGPTDPFYYSIKQLLAGDLPPGAYYLNKTLGSTDGTGKEVRFAPTVTLYPEKSTMSDKIVVNVGFTDNFYRFYRKSSIVWDDVKEMMNYGCGIAFHNVEASNEKDPALILDHYKKAQEQTLKNLGERGCKYLAEPDGNKAYTTAAQSYDPIRIITAQQEAEALYPFRTNGNLYKFIHQRYFFENPDDAKKMTEMEFVSPKEDKKAIHLGVHNTADDRWVNFLVWLNDTYGKDGDDSLWFPSMDEYYEYNYYRMNGTHRVEQIDEQTLKIIVSLPSEQYFYYPSITLNLTEIDAEQIASIDTNEAISGFSYSVYGKGITMNLDFRKFISEQAEEFVKRYEIKKTDSSYKVDALYFVNMLKDSETKTKLLNHLK